MSELRLFPAEIEAWRPPERLTVSEWADRHRVLVSPSAEPGPWRTERTPYLREILDCFSDPDVVQITIMASTQVAKTEAQLNCLGYIIDQCAGPALVVMPTEDSAIRFSQRRLRPMLESSPRLSGYISDWKSDNKIKEMQLGQTLLTLAWANSPTALASDPRKYVLLDEVDKYPTFSGREADPISLATERQRTYWDRKRVVTSTPTTREGYIHREMEVSEKHRYFVPCPRCNAFQTLVFSQVKWPKDVRDPAAIERDRLAWYECLRCEAELNDLDKFVMTADGVWCPEGCKVTQGGVIEGDRAPNNNRGFYLSSLYSPWLNFSEIAAKFLEAKDDTPRLLNFVNSWLGEIWEEKGEEISPGYLATRAAANPRGEVPPEAIVLTAGVDVQEHTFYYAIRAWAPGENSWLVQADRVDDWETLLRILLHGDFPVMGVPGKRQRVRLTCLDSGYRTDEVYRVCQRWPDLARPIKGQARIAGGIPIKMARVERTFSGKVAKSGVQLWHLDTKHFKDKLARLIRTPMEERGAWKVHDNPPEEYLRHIASEHKVIRVDKKSRRSTSEWVVRPGYGGNHWLDCEVYALAAAEMMGVYAVPVADQGVSAEPGDQERKAPEPEPRLGFDTRPNKRRRKPRRGRWATGDGWDR